jgi:ABC-2 type transport system permease protein
MSALFVMWNRQIKEYVRNKQRLIVSLVQPLLFLIAFGFGLGNLFESSGNGDYIQYLLPGIVGMTIMMNSMMGGMSLIWDKKFGFLKETLVAPVSRTSLLFGRCLGVTTTSTFQGLVVLFLGYFMGFRIVNWGIFPIALLFMSLIGLLFSLIGTTLASIFDDMQSFPSVMNFLMMPMMFISNAFFSTENFPSILQFLIKINPFNYSVNLLRFSLSAIETNVNLAISVIGILIVLIGILGTWFFSKMES